MQEQQTCFHQLAQVGLHMLKLYNAHRGVDSLITHLPNCYCYYVAGKESTGLC